MNCFQKHPVHSIINLTETPECMRRTLLYTHPYSYHTEDFLLASAWPEPSDRALCFPSVDFWSEATEPLSEQGGVLIKISFSRTAFFAFRCRLTAGEQSTLCEAVDLASSSSEVCRSKFCTLVQLSVECCVEFWVPGNTTTVETLVSFLFSSLTSEYFVLDSFGDSTIAVDCHCTLAAEVESPGEGPLRRGGVP